MSATERSHRVSRRLGRPPVIAAQSRVSGNAASCAAASSSRDGGRRHHREAVTGHTGQRLGDLAAYDDLSESEDGLHSAAHGADTQSGALGECVVGASAVLGEGGDQRRVARIERAERTGGRWGAAGAQALRLDGVQGSQAPTAGLGDQLRGDVGAGTPHAGDPPQAGQYERSQSRQITLDDGQQQVPAASDVLDSAYAGIVDQPLGHGRRLARRAFDLDEGRQRLGQRARGGVDADPRAAGSAQVSPAAGDRERVEARAGVFIDEPFLVKCHVTRGDNIHPMNGLSAFMRLRC